MLGILDWHNENSLNHYPLSSRTEFDEYIADANYVQFDNFIPTLINFDVSNTEVTANITTDSGDLATEPFSTTDYDNGLRSTKLKYNGRFLGEIVFSDSVRDLWSSQPNRVLAINTSFSPIVVKTIPRASGVFTLDNHYGALTLDRAATDKNIFYNKTANGITINAVGNHALGDGNFQPLKQLNFVPPVNNNITIGTNDIVKVVSPNESQLRFELVGADLPKSSSKIFTTI